MERIVINTNKKYDVVLGKDILKYTGEYLLSIGNNRKVLIVTDDLVEKYWYETVYKSIWAKGFIVTKYVVPQGENSKSFDNLIKITDYLGKNNFDRNDIVVALGGGVIGDLAGFSASIYMRGIKFVQIPTTLLAQIDSSVGGKTAINLSFGKNLVGSFYQPDIVIADVNTLSTLSNNVFMEGMGEMVKYGILDKEMFSLLSCCKKPDILKLIKRSIEIKRDIVVADEKENSIRSHLNLGHTVGHALELISNYSIYHGDGVSQGLYYVVYGSKKCGYLKDEEYDKILSMLENNHIYFDNKYSVDKIVNAISHDKKMENGKIGVIVVKGIGKVEKVFMTINKFREFISWK